MLVAGLDISGPGSVLEATGILAGILAVHEGGHFLAARAQGIHVSKFSIGFGPPLITTMHDGVEFSLRAIPLGGFVGFPDDDPDSPFEEDDPNLLRNRPPAQRAAVVSAGVLANCACAVAVLFSQVNTVGLQQFDYQPGVRVPDVLKNTASSPARAAGLREGDVILEVNGETLIVGRGAVKDLVQRVSALPGEPVDLVVRREEGDKSVLKTLTVIPRRADDGKGRIGVTLEANSTERVIRADSAMDAVRLSAKEFVRLGNGVLSALKELVTNASGAMDQLSGPVAVVAMGAEVARDGASGLYQFAAALNVNLAVWNSLPLPALDGGYLALIAAEAIRGGRKVPDNVEKKIMNSGLLLFLTLGMALVVRDTINLF